MSIKTQTKAATSSNLIAAMLLLTLAQPVLGSNHASDAAIASQDSSGKHQFKSADIVSIDNFTYTDQANMAIAGNGSGDLLLVMKDYSGKSPRKKSLMLDLSIVNEDGELNDLTCTDILNAKTSLAITHPDLSDFITRSKNKDQIRWQVFGIANHYQINEAPRRKNPLGSMPDVDLVNYGIVITELSKNSEVMDSREMHITRALRADLVLQNLIYEIPSNGSMTTFNGEPAAFEEQHYGKLTNGAEATGSLNDKMYLNMHKLVSGDRDSSTKNWVYPKLIKIGSMKLQQPTKKNNNQWTLVFKPR